MSTTRPAPAFRPDPEDALNRAVILAILAYVPLLPFLNFGILATGPWTFEMGTERWIYLVLPGLALLSLACSFSGKTSRQAVHLDALVAACAVSFCVLLVIACLLLSALVAIGAIALLPLTAIVIAMNNGASMRWLPVIPGMGGWLLFAGTIAATLQALRLGRKRVTV